MNPAQEKINIEAFNKVQNEQGTGKQYVSGQGVIPNTPITTEISADKIGTAQPAKVSPMPTSTTALGFGAELTANSNAGVDDIQREQDALIKKTELDAKVSKGRFEKVGEALSDYLNNRKSKSAVEDQAYSETNNLGTTVDDTASTVRSINNKINAIDIRTNEQLQGLEKTFSGTLQGKADAIRSIERNAAFNKADLYIDKLMAQGAYDDAKSIADRKVSLAMEEDKMKLDKLQFDYENNKDLFTKAEQREFELAQADRTRELERKESELTTISNLAMDAWKNGASPSVVSQIRSAKTLDEALVVAGGVLRSANQIDAPTVKTINGVDMQWNTSTGQWETIDSATTPGSIDNTQKSLDQLSFLRTTAKEAKDLASAAGPSGISKFLGDTFVGNTKFRQLEAVTNTLKTNVLSLMTDPTIKKFFGPQMSNADVLLMTSAGTTLNPQANTEKQMKAEIKRLDDLFNRMQTAVKNGTSQSQNLITAEDGEIIQIID